MLYATLPCVMFRPNGYDPVACSALGPTTPNPNLNLPAIGLGLSKMGGWRTRGLRVSCACVSLPVSACARERVTLPEQKVGLYKVERVLCSRQVVCGGSLC